MKLLFIIRSALAAFAWHTDWNLANAYQVRTIRQRRLASSVADFLGKINHARMFRIILWIGISIKFSLFFNKLAD